MRLIKEHPWYSEANEQRLVLASLVAIATIAAINAVLLLNIGLPFLYLVPLTITAAFFSRWQVFAISVICTLFAEGLSRSSLEIERIPRAIVIFASYIFIGLMVRNLVIYRRAGTRRMHELEEELVRLHRADVQSQLVLNSAPVGVLTVSPDGTILSSNRTAHEILAVGMGGLVGKSIGTFLSSDQEGDRSESQRFEYMLMQANGDRKRVQVWTTSIAADDQALNMLVISPP